MTDQEKHAWEGESTTKFQRPIDRDTHADYITGGR